MFVVCFKPHENWAQEPRQSLSIPEEEARLRVVAGHLQGQTGGAQWNQDWKSLSGNGQARNL